MNMKPSNLNKYYFVVSMLIGTVMLVYIYTRTRDDMFQDIKMSVNGRSNYRSSSVNKDYNKDYASDAPLLTNLTKYSKTCTPLKDVSYIFNRKTGSTTLVTILSRFGKQNKMRLQRMATFHKGKRYMGASSQYYLHGKNSPNVSLPVTGVSRKERRLVARDGETLNFVAVDANRLKVLSKTPQTILVSIVRDPATNFESAFNFFNLGRYVSRARKRSTRKKLQTFLSNPEYYRKKIPSGRNWGLTRNGQAWHLGLDHRYHDRDDIVNEYFTRLAKELDLVLVTEYYDQSLILLKRILCWKMENILYLARRVRKQQAPTSEATKKKIRKWNNVDMKLYQIFNSTLWRKIRQYGPDFEKDLRDFRHLRDAVSKDCISKNTLTKQTIKLLTVFDTKVSDPRRFCHDLESWFDLNRKLSVQSGLHGLDAFSWTLKGLEDPLGNLISTKKGNEDQCVKVYYHKRQTKSPTDTKTLEMFISKMKSDIQHITIQNKSDNSYVASYNTGKWNSFQVTTYGRYTDEPYAIHSVSITNGRCNDM